MRRHGTLQVAKRLLGLIMLSLLELKLILHELHVLVFFVKFSLHFTLCFHRSLQALHLLANLLLIFLELHNLALQILVLVHNSRVVILTLVSLYLECYFLADSLVHGEAHFIAQQSSLTRLVLRLFDFPICLLQVARLTSQLGLQLLYLLRLLADLVLLLLVLQQEGEQHLHLIAE